MKTPPLSKVLQEELLYDFCEALANLRTVQEVLPFLEDLLTRAEVLMLTKRLQIARLLLDGKDYRTIQQGLRVSPGTVARVAAWLQEAGEGFRMATERTKNSKKLPRETWQESSEWTRLKRRYPMMFWPQLLLEEVVRSANRRERERIQKAVDHLDHKSKLYRHLNDALRSPIKGKSRGNFNAT